MEAQECPPTSWDDGMQSVGKHSPYLRGLQGEGFPGDQLEWRWRGCSRKRLGMGGLCRWLTVSWRGTVEALRDPGSISIWGRRGTQASMTFCRFQSCRTGWSPCEHPASYGSQVAAVVPLIPELSWQAGSITPTWSVCSQGGKWLCSCSKEALADCAQWGLLRRREPGIMPPAELPGAVFPSFRYCFC